MLSKIFILLILFCCSTAFLSSSYNETRLASKQCDCKGKGSFMPIDSLFRELILDKYSLDYYRKLSININLMFLYRDSAFSDPHMGIMYFCEIDSTVIEEATSELIKSPVFQKYFLEKKQMMLRTYLGGYGDSGFAIKVCGIKEE